MRKNKRWRGPEGGRRWTRERSEPLVARQVSPFASRVACFLFASERARVNVQMIRIGLLRGEIARSDRPAESKVSFQAQLSDTIRIFRRCCNAGGRLKVKVNLDSRCFFLTYSRRKSLIIQSDEISHMLPDFGFQASRIKCVPSRGASEREVTAFCRSDIRVLIAQMRKNIFAPRENCFRGRADLTLNVPGRESARFLSALSVARDS